MNTITLILSLSFGLFALNTQCDEQEDLAKLRERLILINHRVTNSFPQIEPPVASNGRINGSVIYTSSAGRPIEQLVNNPRYRNCRSMARLISHHLENEGYENTLVAAVETREFEKICTQRGESWKGDDSTPFRIATTARRINAGGHDLLLIKSKCSKNWYYINPNHLLHDQTLTLSKKKPAELSQAISKTPQFIPRTVVQKQVDHLAKQGIEVDANLLIFSLHGSEFTHSYTDRLNMIASGDANNSACRYNLPNHSLSSYQTSELVVE